MEKLSEFPRITPVPKRTTKLFGFALAATIIAMPVVPWPVGLRHTSAPLPPAIIHVRPHIRPVVSARAVHADALRIAHHKMAVRKIAMELTDNSTGQFNADYRLDARTTNTADWSCIRNAESHDNYRQPSGAYGILLSSWRGLGLPGTPGQASIRLQDKVALRIFAMNHHRFLGSWNNVCTLVEGLG